MVVGNCFTDDIYSLYAEFVAKVLTAVRLKERTLATLREIAKREDESVSEIIRRLVEDFVKGEVSGRK
jgi:hypothetical protein